MSNKEPIPQNILYWDRNFTLGSRMFLNNNPEPAIIHATTIQEELDRVVNVIQGLGIHTIYVNSESDFVFLNQIQTQLAQQYNYHYDVKMEVK